ncbi:hypothetical protein SAMN02745166_03163 [Prosthecobacter debontii]|uniref:Uncharacterized protein n=1 Tax=Prosthecobacter debontii TaxID=48467 RepID=A0A1T4YH23_9BACT|nr:hypothetical protein SAMN02745166_03163 [Prosthecobacter debontii]
MKTVCRNICIILGGPPEALKNRLDRVTPFPSSRNVQIHLGERGSDLILLIHGWTT